MFAWARASRRRRVKRLQAALSALRGVGLGTDYVPADVEVQVAGHLVEQGHGASWWAVEMVASYGREAVVLPRVACGIEARRACLTKLKPRRARDGGSWGEMLRQRPCGRSEGWWVEVAVTLVMGQISTRQKRARIATAGQPYRPRPGKSLEQPRRRSG